jgi:putative acetyltransferase
VTIPASADVTLLVAAGPADFTQARRLFEEYAGQLGVDLCFQNFSAELDRLHEMYAPPAGRLILARRLETPVGCVAVRMLRQDAGTCEMKRLFVREEARGIGLGRRLAAAAVEAGRDLGYSRMVLDTLGTMTRALALYAELGFREIDPYYANPNDDVKYLELRL